MTTEITRVDPDNGPQLSPEFEEFLRGKFQSDQKEGATAHMAQQGGILGGIEGIEVFGVPVGQALAGGTIALLASELVDGVIGGTNLPGNDNVTGGLVKLAAGAVIAQSLGGFIGRSAANTAATFIAFDAMREILPLDNLIRDLLGAFGGGGNGSAAQRAAPAAQGALNGAVSEEDLLDQALRRAMR